MTENEVKINARIEIRLSILACEYTDFFIVVKVMLNYKSSCTEFLDGYQRGMYKCKSLTVHLPTTPIVR